MWVVMFSLWIMMMFSLWIMMMLLMMNDYVSYMLFSDEIIWGMYDIGDVIIWGMYD